MPVSNMNDCQRALLIGLLWGLSCLGAHAGPLHRCTDARGQVTFSDSGCPAGALQAEAVTLPDVRPPRSDPHDYWSTENQLQRMQGTRDQTRGDRAGRRSTGGGERRQGRAPNEAQAAEPVLTYEQARDRALDATGYHDYDRLSRSQQRRVDQEMNRYPHRPAPSHPHGRRAPGQAHGKTSHSAADGYGVEDRTDGRNRRGYYAPSAQGDQGEGDNR
jgi:hypothetical protein